MIKIIKIILLVFFILILFIEVILISLNYIFAGVPIYRQMNLKAEQVISHYQNEYRSKKIKTLDDTYIREFDGFTKKSFLKKYLEENNVKLKDIRHIKGEDINFPIFLIKIIVEKIKMIIMFSQT